MSRLLDPPPGLRLTIRPLLEADPDSLQALNTAELQDGALAFVTEIAALGNISGLYRWALGSTTPVAAPNVIADARNTGRWIALPSGGGGPGAGALLRDGSTTLTGNWSTGPTFRISTLDPLAAQDVATRNYVDTSIAGVAGAFVARDGSTPLTGDWSTGATFRISTLDPLAAQDVATKAYVDGLVSSPNWATVLSAGPNSGAANPVVDTGQALILGNVNPATTGTVRMEQGGSIYARTTLNTNALVVQFSSDQVALGSPGNNTLIDGANVEAVAVGTARVSAGTTTLLNVNGADRVVVTPTSITLLPNGVDARATFGNVTATFAYSTAGVVLQALVGTPTTTALYAGAAGAPSATNYALAIADDNGINLFNATTSARLAVLGLRRVSANTASVAFHPDGITQRVNVGSIATSIFYSTAGMAITVNPGNPAATIFYGVTASTANWSLNIPDTGDVVTLSGTTSSNLAAANTARVSATTTQVAIIPNGVTTRSTFSDTVLTLSYSTQGLRVQALVGTATTTAFYAGGVGAPSATNYALLISDAGDTVLNGVANVRLSVANVGRVFATTTQVTITPVSTTRATFADTVLTLSYSTQGMRVQALVGTATTTAFYGGGVTPSATNHSLLINDAGDSATLNGSSNVRFAVGNVARVFATTTQVTIVPVSTTRATFADTLLTLSYSTQGMRIQAQAGTATSTAFYGVGVGGSTATNHSFVMADAGTTAAINGSTSSSLQAAGTDRVMAGVSSVTIIPNGVTTRLTATDSLATLNAIPLALSNASVIPAAIASTAQLAANAGNLYGVGASNHSRTLVPTGISVQTAKSIAVGQVLPDAVTGAFTVLMDVANIAGLANGSGLNTTRSGALKLRLYGGTGGGYAYSYEYLICFEWTTSPGVINSPAVGAPLFAESASSTNTITSPAVVVVGSTAVQFSGIIRLEYRGAVQGTISYEWEALGAQKV